MATKSTPEQIRARFDGDVERFSDLETGQTATIDAPLMMDLVARAASAVSPGAKSLLDVGCGAGNYTPKLLQHLPDLDATLIDLSRPMLDRAHRRASSRTSGAVETIQGDIREIEPGRDRFDVILAAMVLHHLRTADEWRAVFAKFFDALRPGGSLWVADLMAHDDAAVQALMWGRYGEYLTAFKGEAYRDHVFAYVEQEDTPRSLTFQVDLARHVGFRTVEILHKNGPFAAFGAIK